MAASNSNSIGYGPSSVRWNRLFFDGDADRYEQWEVKFLGYMKLKKLKSVINSDADTVDADKNEEAYAELIQLIDDRSLALVMRDAKDDGRKALQLLRGHYAGAGKPRVIALYTELTSLRKTADQSATDYILKAEKISSALLNAGETISDSLVIAMLLKGLPAEYKSFVAIITQSEETHKNFAKFKVALRNFEDTEQARSGGKDSIMRFSSRDGKYNNTRGGGVSSGVSGKSREITCYSCNEKGHKSTDCQKKVTCYSCNEKGHKSTECQNKKSGRLWCKHCKSKTHNDSSCRKSQSHQAKQIKDEGDGDRSEHTFSFTVKEDDVNIISSSKINSCQSMLVDTGATSHIVNSSCDFVDVNNNFNPENHFVELADGTKTNNVAMKQGSVKVQLRSDSGDKCDAVLENTLYIPSYPQDIFSVYAATKSGATVNFGPESAELITKDGTRFNIEKKGKLYFLDKCNAVKSSNRVSDLFTWHHIMGHCNMSDVSKMEGVVKGMKIDGRQDVVCENCILGKTVQEISRKPDERATAPLEFIHVDLSGPIEPVARDGFRYVLAFVDDYSTATFVYFLKHKSDAVRGLEQFLADSSPYGNVKYMRRMNEDFLADSSLSGEANRLKRLRSDNGGEFVSKEFETILVKNKIKHETSCPYSPHQNGTVERGWRTIFDMTRCLLLDSKLPKSFWTYAVMTSVYIRNRCYSQRTKQTPYFMMTGKQPDVSRMHVFGTTCYAYEVEKKKLDDRCRKGLFLGYDKGSPAYLVYYADTDKVKKHRCVKFTDIFPQNDKVKPSMFHDDDDDFPGIISGNPVPPVVPDAEAVQGEVQEVVSEDANIVPIVTEVIAIPDEAGVNTEVGAGDGSSSDERRYPSRDRHAPQYLGEYVVDDQVYNIDFCYTVNNIDIPKSYTEAVESPECNQWKAAMDEEVKSLSENDTYSVVELPEGKQLIGGKWVYATKVGSESVRYKARYVAKGFTQQYGSDYLETFAPTCKITTIRIMMQIAVEYDLILHQMDVKTAYLNAPIDYEIYIDQPEGYEQSLNNVEGKAVCKLNKSLYGLKQSGRNWNILLHKFLVENKLIQSLYDPCVYTYRSNSDLAFVLIWVDDIVIAAISMQVMNKIKDMLKNKFKMKDLGVISWFLGIEFKQTKGLITMSQSKYLKSKLEKFRLDKAKPRVTPCELAGYDSDKFDDDKSLNYREMVGSLIYAMTCTRPDLSWSVSKLSQHLANPSNADYIMVKHVFRFILGTLDYKLSFRKSKNTLKLVGYSDADWGSCVEDRKSTSGYYFTLNDYGPAVCWKSKKQNTVALSSCESEYMALSAAVQEAIYLERLLHNVVEKSFEPVIIHVDNQGAIALAKNPVHHNRTKHIDIRYHFVKENVLSKKVELAFVPSEENIADIMTKPCSKVKLVKFKDAIFGY